MQEEKPGGLGPWLRAPRSLCLWLLRSKPVSGRRSRQRIVLPCRWRLLASVIIDRGGWLSARVGGAGLLSVDFTVKEELPASLSAWAHLGLPWPHRKRWGGSALGEVL